MKPFDQFLLLWLSQRNDLVVNRAMRNRIWLQSCRVESELQWLHRMLEDYGASEI